MRHSTLFGVLFIGMTALSGVACSVSGSTESTGEGQSAVRGVRGHLKSGAATSVVAVVDQADTEEAKTYSAPVDAQGNFRLTLPRKARYVLAFMDGDQERATLQFASSAGGEVTSLFPLAGRPERTRGGPTSDEPEEEGDVDLGEVDASEGRCDHNPLEQVDWDSDGSSDYEDADDDDDGTADVDDEDNHHHGSSDHGGGHNGGRPDKGDGHECEGGHDGGDEGEDDGGDEDGGEEGEGGGEEGEGGGDEGEGGGEVPEIPSPG
ncbi:uncharacterized protein SOCE26_088490 [Sorangium cellulosum]|uniref:Carboxypeptidase regulatory-like domain-containing protein n=1 Tax=Sorangium cellulosum TaxID=56 RepID=A0A2L0F6Z4_SORCE|nr:hypothetical protein [Sorangium cellulosum]AUX47330.1 uncharacterized protein SOCE26_088490 [Sorangium cellulosum]